MNKNTVSVFLGSYNAAVQGECGRCIPDSLSPECKIELLHFILEDKPPTVKQIAAFRVLLEALLKDY